MLIYTHTDFWIQVTQCMPKNCKQSNGYHEKVTNNWWPFTFDILSIYML